MFLGRGQETGWFATSASARSFCELCTAIQGFVDALIYAGVYDSFLDCA